METINKLDSISYYTVTKKYHDNYPVLQQDIEADVVVVGGGFSGINTALELAEQGITNIVVLEARHLGYGGTGRNGGQIMAGIGHDLDAIKKHVGEDGLKSIINISNDGQKIIRERIEKYNIDADFCHGYAYMGFNSRQEKTLSVWEKEFKEMLPDDDIELLTGADVKQVIGSDAYTSCLKYMGGGHVHSLNLLLGEAKALVSYGASIYENSQVLDVQYGDTVTIRTAMGSVKAKKMLWACDSWLDGMEPELHKKTINTQAFQIATEPLSDELINQISPIRGAYSDIRPVIDYYRVTKENRLLFGSATPYIEYTPVNISNWCRDSMLKIFPYLDKVKIDMAWGGWMAVGKNLFPQIGTIPNQANVFYVQGYAGFGVTPSHIVCKVLAEGIMGGSERYDLMKKVKHVNIIGKDNFRKTILSAGKTWHQISGFWTGRR